MLGPHSDSYLDRRKGQRQRFKTAAEHEAARDQIALACVTDACPLRPVFDEPRVYIDDSRW